MPPCPSCSAPLTGAPACPSCGLRLTGPVAARLWEVDVALAELDGRRADLLRERAGLLAQLRPEPGAAARPPLPPPAAPFPVPVPSPEATRRSAQNTLLGLGALLLAVAATVFAAVTYERLGGGGRAVVLLALTGLAAAAVPALLRRGLSASAETATTVALVLGVLDAYGLRTLGLGRDLDLTTYAAAAAAVLAALAALAARAVPVRVAAIAAVVLAHLAPALLLTDARLTSSGAALVLVALGAADLLLLQTRVLQAARTAAVGCGLLSVLAALQAAAVAAVDAERLAPLALLLLAALSAAAATSTATPLLRQLLAAVPVPLAELAAWSPLHLSLTQEQEPLVASAVGLLGVLIATGLPRAWRPGPATGALAVAGLALLTQAQAVAQGLVRPFGWLGAAWTLNAASAPQPGPLHPGVLHLGAQDPGTGSARAALSPEVGWDGTSVVLVVLLAAAATAVLAGAALRREEGLAAGGLLAVLGAALLPLALDLPYGFALAVLLGLAVLLILGRLLGLGDALRTGNRRRERWEALLLPLAGALGGLACAWATADRTATLVVLPLAAALAAAVSAAGQAHRSATATAGLLLGAEVAAVGAAAGLAAEQVGPLLVPVVAVLVALPLRGRRRTGAEAAAVGSALAALGLASADPGWLSWTLAGLGLVALALAALGGALRPDRRLLAPAGAVLLSASSWVRLAEAGVSAPEPYVVPLGLLALLLGHLRRRSAPATGSFAAYGPGLSALLLPSLLAALDGDALLRPLLLGLGALGVLLAGVRTRLRAPLAFGGGVLAVDALHLLLPYAAALPRWMPLALAGALLLGLGATYEQRRRDLAALRARYDALA